MLEAWFSSAQLKLVFEFAALVIILCVVEYAYISIARRQGVLDIANGRSSHTGAVVRGGLVIFPLSLLFCYFVTAKHFIFTMGLILVAAVSLLDDFRSVSPQKRLIVHLLAAMCVMFPYEITMQPTLRLLLIVPIALFLMVGVFNAYNFMDGINGLTVGYALLTFLTLYLFNRAEPFITPRLFIYAMVPLLIFFPLNVKRHAVSFAGDVGAISIGYVVIFMLYGKIFVEYDPFWLILVGVYGVDSGLTILYRILNHENILLPHRKHLFQLMANELHIPHLRVTAIYVVVQAIINVGFAIFYPYRAIYAPIMLVILIGVYVLMKRKYGYLLTR